MVARLCWFSVCFMLRMWTVGASLWGLWWAVGASAVGGAVVCRAGFVARPGVLLGCVAASPPGLSVLIASGCVRRSWRLWWRLVCRCAYYIIVGFSRRASGGFISGNCGVCCIARFVNQMLRIVTPAGGIVLQLCYVVNPVTTET